MRSTPSALHPASKARGKLRAFELERPQFGVDRLVELLRGARSRGRQLLRGAPVAPPLLCASLSSREPLNAGIDQRQVGP
jgi:hypothetical protein